MDRFRIEIKFKDGKILPIEIDSEEDLRNEIAKTWSGKKSALFIGDYVISTEDIRWIKVEGERLEKPSGKQLPDIREEK